MSFTNVLGPLQQLPLCVVYSAISTILRHTHAGPLKLAVRKWVGPAHCSRRCVGGRLCSAQPRRACRCALLSLCQHAVCYNPLLKRCLPAEGAVVACHVATEEMGGARSQERSLLGGSPKDLVCAWDARASPSQRTQAIHGITISRGS